MKLPSNPAILLSMINMKLRDEQIDFTEFCKTYSADEELVTEKLASIGYRYHSEKRQFVYRK